MKKIFYAMMFLVHLSFNAQTIIKGKVTDDAKEPLPGASIIIKGSIKGEITDFDGNFTLTVPKTPATLVVSYLGYTTKEVIITNQTTLLVELKIDTQQLEEVVIIGYGSVNKKDVTGSISSIKPTKTVAEQSRGVQDIIRGRAAGVQVFTNGAEPGGSISIRIRGTSSLTGNSEPLYVVDGIIMDTATEDTGNPVGGYTSQQGGFSGVNPQDIESIEILKDASATAIYGSRAANGVIIITTKKGKTGKAKFNFTSQFSIGSVTRSYDVLDTAGYTDYQNNMQLALGQNPPYTINTDGAIFTNDANPTLVEGINWAEDTYKLSIIKNNRLSISGGGDKGNYFLATGFVSNEGTFPNAKAETIDLNFNLNQDLNDKLKLSLKFATTFTDLSSSRGTDENASTNTSMVRQVLLAAPILNFSENNLNGLFVDENVDGPRAWTTDYDDLADEIRLLGSLNLDYKISKSLTYRLRFGGDYRNKERSFWFGTALLRGRDANGFAGIATLERFRYNIDNTIMYKVNIGKKHRIDATLGYLIDKTSITTTRYSASNFADKSLRADGISFAGTNTPLIIDSEKPTILSYIGRLNYTLLRKYIFTATFRADGSSKFAKGNRWGYFPAVSFAWKASEEKFIKNIDFISDLKLRLGYGEVGNQNISSYRFLTPFGRTEEALADGDGNPSLIPVIPQNLANPDLKWESAVQYNAGIDFGFFNDKLTGTVDAYHKSSANLLLNVPVGPTSGFTFITANQGNIENRGVEFSLNSNIIEKDDFTWSAFGNISFNKNKVVKIGTNSQQFGALGNVVAFLGNNISGGTHFKQPANIFVEGREVGLFYGFQTNGIIKSDAELTNTPSGDPLKFRGTNLRVGDVNFVDQNGDGDINDDDKTIIGNPNPDFNYAFGSSFSYKDFSVSFLFNGIYGNDIANANLLELDYANNSPRNVLKEAYNNAFDAVNNPNGTYPAVGVGGIGTDYTREFNDRIVQKGSFLRLSYVAFDYNIPVKNIKYIDQMKLTLSGQNLWLLTDYKGFDPEVNSFAFDPTRIGVDSGSFPNQKSFTIGLNVSF